MLCATLCISCFSRKVVPSIIFFVLDFGCHLSSVPIAYAIAFSHKSLSFCFVTYCLTVYHLPSLDLVLSYHIKPKLWFFALLFTLRPGVVAVVLAVMFRPCDYVSKDRRSTTSVITGEVLNTGPHKYCSITLHDRSPHKLRKNIAFTSPVIIYTLSISILRIYCVKNESLLLLLYDYTISILRIYCVLQLEAYWTKTYIPHKTYYHAPCTTHIS